MDIVYPARAEGGLPTVVWVHGGGWSDEKLTRRYLPSVELAELSGRGYTTVSIDYRLSQAAPFPAQIEDCKAAVRFLRANAQKYLVDPERIAAWGESAGGHLVELMAYTAEEEFRNDCYPSFSASILAVIPWYAPDDLRMDEEKWNGQEAYKRMFPIDEEEERLKMMELASPIIYAGRKNPPTLLMHGDADRLVSPECSKNMCKALKDAGNDAELILVPGQGHGFFFSKTSKKPAIAPAPARTITGPLNVPYAAILGIGRATAYKLANSGAFKTIRIGNMIRISRKSFEDWLKMKGLEDETK